MFAEHQMLSSIEAVDSCLDCPSRRNTVDGTQGLNLRPGDISHILICEKHPGLQQVIIRGVWRDNGDQPPYNEQDYDQEGKQQENNNADDHNTLNDDGNVACPYSA